MKKFLALFLVLGSALCHAQEKDFPGVRKAMSPEEYEQAGMSKLSPEERERLDQFIRNAMHASNEKAATAAVDRAVKEEKVSVNEPEVIQSRIVGRFTGYNGRSRFQLENGEVWAQSQQISRAYPPVDSPPVLIVKGKGVLGGHRMYILGGGEIRVSRVK